MSRNHGRREEPASSHWEPGYRRFYSDEHSRRRYRPSTEPFLGNGFNYWQDFDIVSPDSYYPRRSYGREGYNERWRDDSRSRHAESSYTYPRRRHDFGPSRYRDDRETRRDNNQVSPRSSSRQHHSTYTLPNIARPTIRARGPIESIPSLPKPVAPEPLQKVSPPPDTASKLLKPSPGYLALSHEPSEILHDPATSRKLLVLDLNGTLLIRSSRSRATSGLQLRSVQPRPYMQCFRQYLFCLETEAWLDTMVWSSAQPHSVNDMVDKVFGTTRGGLKAVWDRKSLGLSEADYHRKAVTTKDLAKPWDLFASGLISEKVRELPAAPRVAHSAFTTLLLDDSPHKAVLQPYNHVCVPEYDSARRWHDLLAIKSVRQNKQAKRKDKAETAAHSSGQVVPELVPSGPLTGLAEGESYDVILLAVIGILETMKLQSNVAGWIYKGGLWAIQEREEEGGASDVKHRNTVKTEGGKTVLNRLVLTGSDASSTADPTVNPEQAHLQTKMWFDDSSVVAFWVARGRRALMELGIQIVHGVTE